MPATTVTAPATTAVQGAASATNSSGFTPESLDYFRCLRGKKIVTLSVAGGMKGVIAESLRLNRPQNGGILPIRDG